METKIKDLMPPKWLKFQCIPHGSIGWRMGGGEEYGMEQYSWFLKLSDAEKEEYDRLFPRPLFWQKNGDGWYENDYTYNIKWLKNQNNPEDFVLFWGHRPSKDGLITKTCFSQWYLCHFQIGHLRFCCMEQYMMYRKAILFKDDKIAEKILASDSPSEMKRLGRRVANFNEDKWNENKYDIVVLGNYFKFIQNRRLLNYLFSTKNSVLVEASPEDKIWGIGLSAENPDALDVEKWQGENLLGFALMEVRENLKQILKNEHLFNKEDLILNW